MSDSLFLCRMIADRVTPREERRGVSADEFEVRRLGYSSNPWRVVHVPTDREVYVPRTIQNADGKDVHFNGPACFPRKRDALAWMRDELPRLLAA